MADVHLGFRQYGLSERAADFCRAFDSAIDYCLTEKPDFVVIAGDLFDAKSIDPQTYAQADAALHRLSQANIPVVANEGNHERWFRRGDHSWLWQLSRHGRLRLLRQFDPITGKPHAGEWTAERGFGAYTDIGSARIFGVEYLGARLPAHIDEIAASLSRIPRADVRAVIGIMHTGIDEAFEYGSSGLSLEQLQPLESLTDYLALGHVHHAYQLPNNEPWIFNPGALEAHTVLEGLTGTFVEGQRRERGIFDVRINPGNTGKIEAVFRNDVIVRRLFQRITIDVTKFPSFELLAKAVKQSANEQLGPSDEPAVIDLRLTGQLKFDRLQLDQDALQEIVADIQKALHVRVTKHFNSSSRDIGLTDTTATRQEIERGVIRRLIAASPHAAQSDTLAKATLSLKTAALEGRSPEDMASQLEQLLT
ncbi:MAG: hypothetical protein CL790_00165 [Chloroflexi bacterium]|nr:hypothetical protein [Chloroflexota bacterium]